MKDMISKAKENVEIAKQKLNTISVEGTSGNGKIKVIVNGNREIKSIEIDDQLLQNKEELEDYLIMALNQGIKKASDLNDVEMSSAARAGMPNIPGMF